jgi:glutamate synthase domain-containing protein 2
MHFIEDIAENTGLPVGIKAAIGKLNEWEELADLMIETGKGPDFITVDGGEGGTGAAPPSFADHVSLPWVYGFSDLYKVFKKRNLTDRIVFIGSGKLGFPAKAAMAFAMGADCINVAREAMMSIGCIQAQVCHTNRCPSGVATQSKWLQNGINIPLKSVRLAQYFKTFRKELVEITHAAGYEHPCQFNMKDIDVNVDDHNLSEELDRTYNYQKTPVKFTNMQELKDCIYLGGKY